MVLPELPDEEKGRSRIEPYAFTVGVSPDPCQRVAAERENVRAVLGEEHEGETMNATERRDIPCECDGGGRSMTTKTKHQLIEVASILAGCVLLLNAYEALGGESRLVALIGGGCWGFVCGRVGRWLQRRADPQAANRKPGNGA